MLLVAFLFALAMSAASARHHHSLDNTDVHLHNELAYSLQKMKSFGLTFDSMKPAIEHSKKTWNIETHAKLHTSKACCDCIETVADSVVWHVKYYIIKDCCKGKKDCETYVNQSRVVSGYIMADWKAYVVGWTYCIANATCPNPHNNTLDCPVVMGEEQQLGKMMSMLLHDPKFQLVKPTHDIQEGCCKCKACLDMVDTHIISEAYKMFWGGCMGKDVSDDRKKMCDWAERHSQEFHGVLLYALQPWKYSQGFCFGTGMCGHPPSV